MQLGREDKELLRRTGYFLGLFILITKPKCVIFAVPSLYVTSSSESKSRAGVSGHILVLELQKKLQSRLELLPSGGRL